MLTYAIVDLDTLKLHVNRPQTISHDGAIENSTDTLSNPYRDSPEPRYIYASSICSSEQDTSMLAQGSWEFDTIVSWILGLLVVLVLPIFLLNCWLLMRCTIRIQGEVQAAWKRFTSPKTRW